jgi:predicted secreted protein
MHVLVAALAVSWFRYYVLLWWLVAYRYLDVGPRRALQKLYNTPEKKAARPWAPLLNWAVIVTLYFLAFLAVYNRQVLFAKVPGVGVPVHVPAHWEIGLVWGFNLALVLATWILTKKYTDSLLPRTEGAAKTSAS